MSEALYDRIGVGYSEYRRPDGRIARRIDEALGQSRSVLNVGAGAGSYEPNSRFVVAVEPSAEMIRQRSGNAPQSIRATADRLRFQNCSFDAALAILTIHHWAHRDQGLAEMRRVARDRVVIFTWDPEHPGFWLVRDYIPEILEIDRPNFPSLRDIEEAIGPTEVQTLRVPADCSDGFRAWSAIRLKWNALKRRPIPDDWRTYKSRSALRAESSGNHAATHPVNAMLNYAYGVLMARTQVELIAEGYDPTIGILHGRESELGRYSAFALDRMEPMRPVVDRAVLQLVSSTTFTGADFLIQPDGVCRLNPELARLVTRSTSTAVGPASSQL